MIGLDTLVSVVMKGATLNLDPTLVLKMDPELVSRKGVLKGSEHALVVGDDYAARGEGRAAEPQLVAVARVGSRPEQEHVGPVVGAHRAPRALVNARRGLGG